MVKRSYNKKYNTIQINNRYTNTYTYNIYIYNRRS